jgi:hypothetical protein
MPIEPERAETMPEATSRASSSQDDQIVVATGHLRVVEQTLHAWGVRLDTDQQDEIPELGLTRLFVASLHADVGSMRRDLFLVRAAEAAAAERRPRGAPPASVDDLDLLMFRLRLDSAYRCAGWMPTIGKNRYVESTEALGEIGGGGGGVPELVAQGEIGGGGGGAPDLVAQGEIGGGGGPGVIAQGEIGGGGVSLPRAVELEKANGGDPDLHLTDGRLIDKSSPAGAGKRIALFDTKIWLHPEFEGLNCTNFVKDADAVGTGPMAGHGVFGAGLILRKAPAAELISVPVLDDAGSAQVWDVAKEMVAFLPAENRIDFIHMPWGAITPDGEEPLVLGAAIQRLRRAGVELVAAAGNHGDSADPAVLRNAASYPAALAAVTAVGAAVRPGVAARFSPDPEAAPWIDELRPGVHLVSTFLRDRYAIWGGSSFSAALYVGERAARVTSH